MKKYLFLIFSVTLSLHNFLFSQSDKAELRQDLSDPVVEEELEEPDGVSIKLREDGWVIMARGSGSYDFNDPSDIRNAYKIATLRAKANLAKFLSERISAEDTLTKLTDKRKKLVSGEKPSVSAEYATQISESIKNSSDAITSGVITLSTNKVPFGDGGNVQVNIGQSSKSLAAAGQIRSRTATSLRGKPNSSKSSGSASADSGKLPNNAKRQKADTDF